MKLKLAALAFATGILPGCSTSVPTIELGQLAGDYRASSCPSITISGDKLTFAREQTTFELIRIKNHNIIATAATPRFALGDSCRLVMAKEPSYIRIDERDNQFSFYLLSTGRTEALRFIQEK